MSTQIELKIETSAYNERRYGKPWIANVAFEGAESHFLFGNWVGDAHNGSAGVLVLLTKIGGIVAKGQKDSRQPRNSAPDFYVVQENGELKYIGTKADAYKLYNESNVNTKKEVAPDLSKFTTEQLITELKNRTDLHNSTSTVLVEQPKEI